MVYIEAPATTFGLNMTSIFLAGSITGASDWQKFMVDQLKDLDIMIFNPRRNNFPMTDPTAAEAQITWEHKMLKAATMILFWFAPETLAPITLYECGAWTRTQKPMIIGIDPKYQRKQDVEIQTKLARPSIKVVYSLKDLAEGAVLLYDQEKFQ